MSKQVHEIPVFDEGDGLRPASPPPPPSGAAGTPGLTFPQPLAPYQSAPPPGAPAPQTAPSVAHLEADTLMPPPVAAPLPPMPPPMAPTAAPTAVAPQAAPPVIPQSFAPPMPSMVSPVMMPPVVATSAPVAEDLDPLGRVNAGFTPHPGADAGLISALQEVVRLTASDLHVTSNAPPMLRVDGALTPVEGAQVWDRDRVSKALYSLLTKQQQEKFEKELELDFAFAVSESARFRVNYYQQRDAVGGAFRLIPTEIKPLEQLGVPDTVARFAELARGLVLVTGPTGSGKSTTLAALIDLVNRTRTDHIVTVEDPIEFMHGNKRSLINQREVGSDTHSFGQALKHVLRQDPDVILIGELRDLEPIWLP